MSGIGDTPEDWFHEEPAERPEKRHHKSWLTAAIGALAIVVASALMGVLRDDGEAHLNGSPWRGERIAGIGALV